MTPDEAREYLRESDCGHKLDPATIRSLWLQMGSGQFAPRPPVRLIDGLLHDGRHRLFALVLHGQPVALDVEGTAD